jgi:hypothetical protein
MFDSNFDRVCRLAEEAFARFASLTALAGRMTPAGASEPKPRERQAGESLPVEHTTAVKRRKLLERSLKNR